MAELRLVAPSDTLFEIVRDKCGEAPTDLLWNVVDANSANQQYDGEFLTDIDDIEAGWILEIPCELPAPAPVDCPETSSAAFKGEGDDVRVLICADGSGERTEYVGQRISDGSSVILNACQDPTGRIVAVNASDTSSTFYFVDLDPARVEVVEAGPGQGPESGTTVGSFALATFSSSDSIGLRSCGPAADEPIPPDPKPEWELATYPLDRAPLTEVILRPGFRSNVLCPDGYGSTTLPMIVSSSVSIDANSNRWFAVDQGQRLRVDGVPADRSLRLAGGGHSWPMTATSDGLYELTLTDEQPLGRYAVIDAASEEVQAQVEVGAADEVSVLIDYELSTQSSYLLRLFAAGTNDVELLVAFIDGCNGTGWEPHQTVPIGGQSSSGVAKVRLDLGEAAAAGRSVMVAIQGDRHTKLHPE